MIVLKGLVLVSAFFVGSYGHTFQMGGCPKVKVMKDFDMTKFVGEWYIIGRYNPVGSCTKVFIDKTADGDFTAEESSRPFGFNFGLHHYRMARKLVMVKNDTDAIFKVPHPFKPFSVNTYGVLDTDYETYAIIWGCDPVLMGSIQNLDVLSRNPDSEGNYDILKNSVAAAEKQGIDTRALGKVEHANCLSTKKDGSNMVVAEDHGMEVEDT